MLASFCNPEENLLFCTTKSILGLSPLSITSIFVFWAMISRKNNSSGSHYNMKIIYLFYSLASLLSLFPIIYLFLKAALDEIVTVSEFLIGITYFLTWVLFFFFFIILYYFIVFVFSISFDIFSIIFAIFYYFLVHFFFKF